MRTARVASLMMVMVLMTAPGYAEITVAPFSFSPLGLGNFEPGIGPPSLGRWENIAGDWQLHLGKNVPTAEIAAAGAQVKGVEGLSTTGLTIGFTVENGNCGAGAPRFNVRLMDGSLVFLGCAHADNADNVHSFTAGLAYGGVLFPAGQVIQSISIIFDEGPGDVFLDDIFIGSDSAGSPGRSNK